MASTRNKNDIGNYKAEEYSRIEQRNYLLYENQANGQAYSTHFAGDGLLAGQMGSTNLSYNSTDIDSFLKGIGSTNLVDPAAPVEPQIKDIQSLSIMDKIPLIVTDPIKPLHSQRPLLR
jgi:hypothetical protein